LPEDPERDEPDPALPEDGEAERFVEPFVHAAWPSATPPAKRAKAAMPASTPLRTWCPPPPAGAA
jgi:hypothetical protein